MKTNQEVRYERTHTHAVQSINTLSFSPHTTQLTGNQPKILPLHLGGFSLSHILRGTQIFLHPLLFTFHLKFPTGVIRGGASAHITSTSHHIPVVGSGLVLFLLVFLFPFFSFHLSFYFILLLSFHFPTWGGGMHAWIIFVLRVALRVR